MSAAVALAMAEEEPVVEQHVEMDPDIIQALLRKGLGRVRQEANRFNMTVHLAPNAGRLVLRGREMCSEDGLVDVQIAAAFVLPPAETFEEAPLCQHGVGCFNLHGCANLHPDRWYLDRCPHGAACPFSDCSRIHPRRPAVPCNRGPECLMFTNGCPYLHPRTWYRQQGTQGTPASGPEGSEATQTHELQVPLNTVSAQWIRKGGLIKICASISQFGGTTAHKAEDGGSLVIRGTDLQGLREAAEEVEVLVAEHVSRLQGDNTYRDVVYELGSDTAGRLAGMLTMLQRELNLGLAMDRASRIQEDIVLLSARGLRSDLAAAEDRLLALLVDPQGAEADFHRERTQQVHIFIDNSNLHISAQNLLDGGRDFDVRLNVRGLVNSIRGGRRAGRQVVAGSKPPGNHAIWDIWDKNHFHVELSQRDVETNREDAVDQVLVSHALIHICNVEPGILALGTGDGNLQNQMRGTLAPSFRNLVTTALSWGWFVELWSWRASCSRVYLDLAKESEGRFKIVFLDPLRPQVTFKKNQGRAATGSSPEGPPASAAAAAATDESEALEEADADDQDICVVCLDEYVTHAYDPCSHKALCRSCAELVQAGGVEWMPLCVMCRTPWTSIVQDL